MVFIPTQKRRRLTQLPKVPDGLDHDQRLFLEAVKNQLEALQGNISDQDQRPTLLEFKDVDLVVRSVRTIDPFVYEEMSGEATDIHHNGMASFDETKSAIFMPNVGAQNPTAQVTRKLPQYYLEESEINAHLHWFADDTGTGDVKIRCHYRWTNPTAVQSAYSTVDFTLSMPGVADDLAVYALIELGGVGKKRNSFVDVRLERLKDDPADTYSGDFCVKSIDILYKRLVELPQGLGARSIYYQ